MQCEWGFATEGDIRVDLEENIYFIKYLNYK